MKKRRPAVTLKDIAAKTGYSVNTVSRALRDKDDIAVETREMIQRTAREMGHVSNTLAASLRLGYTNTIAVILGDISNPHFSIMMKEIEGYAWKAGYTSILFNTNENEELELAAIQSALNKNVDGIIICPAQKTPDNLIYLKESGVPFVLIGAGTRLTAMWSAMMSWAASRRRRNCWPQATGIFCSFMEPLTYPVPESVWRATAERFGRLACL